jgi:hypothetical protein
MVLADSHQVSRARCYSGVSSELDRFRIRGYYPLWPVFPDRSATSPICNSATILTHRSRDPTTPTWQRHQAWHHAGLGSSHFARRYSGSRCYFPFLAVLRCFSSRSSLYPPYVFRRESHLLWNVGFPHSEILGSKPIRRFPGAYRSQSRLSSVVVAKASTVGPS